MISNPDRLDIISRLQQMLDQERTYQPQRLADAMVVNGPNGITFQVPRVRLEVTLLSDRYMNNPHTEPLGSALMAGWNLCRYARSLEDAPADAEPLPPVVEEPEPIIPTEAQRETALRLAIEMTQEVEHLSAADFGVIVHSFAQWLAGERAVEAFQDGPLKRPA